MSSHVEAPFYLPAMDGRSFVEWLQSNERLAALSSDVYLSHMRLGRRQDPDELRLILDEMIGSWVPAFGSTLLVERLGLLRQLLDRYGDLAEPPWHSGDVLGDEGPVTQASLLRGDRLIVGDRVWKSNGYALAVLLFYAELHGLLGHAEAGRVAESGVWVLDRHAEFDVPRLIELVRHLIDGSLGYEVQRNELWGQPDSLDEASAFADLKAVLQG